MKYQAYPEYKDSGVEWLGGVPEHWNVSKIKYLTSFQVGWTPPTKDDANFDGDNLWANISDLREHIIHETSKKISDHAAKVASMDITPKGSLLYSFKLSVGTVSFAGKDMYTNEAIASFLEESKLPLTYLYYVLPKFVIENASTNIYGARILNQELIRNAHLLAPTFDEAQHIANFLDHETAKIDTLIEKQQQLIKLLKEKRQAVISHAVTKGVNPNAPMHDSGIEWLGDVPEHWEVKRISYVALLKSGDAIISEQIEEDGNYPVYGGNGLRGYSENFNHDGNHILIGRQGALCGNINYGYGKFWASEHAVVVHPSLPLDFKWLGETLRAMDLNQYNVSAAQPGLAIANITCLKIPFPSVEEQGKIANFINYKTAKIDNLIKKSNFAILLMKERRTALISAAVTGKIDVRNFKKTGV